MTAVTAAVLCRCGHAERMHERDDAEPDGRGACMQRQCGCSGLRPGQSGDAAPPEPVSEPAEKPEPAAVSSLPGVPRCPHCSRTFGTEHGLAVHCARTHKAEPAYAEIAREIQAKIDAEARPAAVVEPEPEEPAAEPQPLAEPSPAPATTPPRDPGRSVVDARIIRADFPAGWMEIRWDLDWVVLTFDERSALMELSSLLFRLGHVDHFAAVIGDPNSDEFNQGAEA